MSPFPALLRARRRSTLRGVAALLLLGVGTGAAAMPMTGPAQAPFEAYDRAVPALMEKWHIPGASLAVAYQGRIVFARGYGYADTGSGRLVQPDTSFRVMSISKIFTASTIMKLVEDGKLSLDEHPFSILNYPTPTYSGARRDARLDRITIRDLLAHTSGWIADYANNPFVGGRGFSPILYQRQIAQVMRESAPGTPEMIIRYMVGQPLQADPGTSYSYCNVGYLVLGRIIEARTGRSYVDAVTEFLGQSYVSSLLPAGSRLSDLAADEVAYYDDPTAGRVTSHFDGSQVPAPYAYSIPGWDAAGGWKMSAIECLRVLLALEGKNGLPALLRPETLAEIRTPRYPSNFYGFGWFTRNASSDPGDSGHGGGSWGSKTYALRSADGNWHTVLFLNSIPSEAFVGGAFEADAATALHSVPVPATAPEWDLTWSTLGWNAWQRRHLAGSADGELDDPDHDGLPNLLEYAAALDPRSADVERAATVSAQPDGTLTFIYRRLVLEHPLTWTIEVSADGSVWSPATVRPLSSTVTPDGALSVSVSLATTPWIRLRVRKSDGVEAALVLDTTPRAEITFTRHPDSQTVAPLSRVTFTAAANSSRPLTYQWLHNGEPVTGATGATLVIASSSPADAGAYSVVARTSNRIETSRTATLVVGTPQDGSIVNMSVRGTAGISGQPLIVGFVVRGGAKRLLLRAVGPGVARVAPIDGLLADPRLELHQPVNGHDTIPAQNDNWSATAAEADELSATFERLGAFALQPGSRDAALLVEVDGLRSMHVNSVTAGSTGLVLVEAYDAATTSPAHLINVSARNHVGTGDDVLVAGFVINGNVPKRLLVRGVGPGLVAHGVTDALADPKLELHTRVGGRDSIIAINDNWGDEPNADVVAAQVGAARLDRGSADAALVVSVPAGIYTAVVAGTHGTTGEALVEVYEVE